MRILILGDLHGSVHLLPAILRGAQEQFRVEAAIQVGDFRFQASTIRAIPVPLHAIAGNACSFRPIAPDHLNTSRIPLMGHRAFPSMRGSEVGNPSLSSW